MSKSGEACKSNGTEYHTADDTTQDTEDDVFQKAAGIGAHNLSSDETGNSTK